MPLHRAMTAAGIILPEELSVLHQVFEITGLPNEAEKHREARAAFIVAIFRAGVKDRDALIVALRSSAQKQ